MANNSIQSFTDLTVWQEGHKFVLGVYRTTKQFPQDERFALTNQIQRAAVSITSNIAEGFSRRNPKEKIQFYYMSLASVAEVQNQLLIARDLGYINKVDFSKGAKQSIVIAKMLNALISSIKNS